MIYVFKDGDCIIMDSLKKQVIGIIEQFPLKKSKDIISSDKLSDLIGLFSSLIEERIKSRLKDVFPTSNFDKLSSSSSIDDICNLIENNNALDIIEVKQNEISLDITRNKVLNTLSQNQNLSIGIDIENLSMFPKKIFNSNNNGFRKEIFSEFEIAYSILKPNPELTLLGIFSAKESIIKAIGSRGKCDFKDIEINYDAAGNPYPIVKDYSSDLFRISISHSDNVAISICLLVKDI